MNVFGLTCDEFAAQMKQRHCKGLGCAKALYRGIFKEGKCANPTAPLAAELRPPSCRIVARREEDVLKFASELPDGLLIESVVIPSPNRATLCISSQVGCAMGCRFCATGRMGLARNLAAEEIVWQVHAARFALGRPIDNVVFMGMGEPLDNFDNVVRAIRVMNDQRGLDIALRKVTLSTAGHADGIKSLAAANLPNLRLAVSLNAAEDGLRNALMPINRRYPLGRLKEELLAFPLGRDGVIFVEYVLLAGINDSEECARRLANYLEGIPVRVNVIPYNCGGSGAYATPAPERVERFCERLAERKLFVRARRSRGSSVMGACGQLGTSLSPPGAGSKLSIGSRPMEGRDGGGPGFP